MRVSLLMAIFVMNKVFILDDRSMPAASMLEWIGSVTIDPSRPFELPIQ